MGSILIRLLQDEDSLDDLTDLLHRSYAELGAKGFRYRAVDQDVSVTKQRVASGECYVVVHDGSVVGTAVLHAPSWRPDWCEWYARPEVASLSH